VKPEVIQICNAVRDAGGRAMLVGGWVRDRLRGVDSKDYDIEVFGVTPSRLRNLLEAIATVNTVGESFAVYKLAVEEMPDSNAASTQNQPRARFEIDVSIPRRESRSGKGHRGFAITGDPSMTFEEAARRRDFTINAILYDPLTDETIDPFGGVADLQKGILRAVAADTFVEDSLRVLRGVQFAARFEMTIDEQTAALCRSIDLSDLPRERVWGEIEKLLTMAWRPSLGLRAAIELGVLKKLFPPLHSLGDKPGALDAICGALDVAAELCADLPKPKRIAVMLAVLCHQLSLAGAAGILDRLGVETLGGYHVREVTLALLSVREKPRAFHSENASDGSVRRLSRKVELDLLYRVAVACRKGVEPDSPLIAEEWFIKKARDLRVDHESPAQLLFGRHLLEAGFEPGPLMGEVLRQVYELQLDGEVTTLEEAIASALRLSAGLTQTGPKLTGEAPENNC
jgi:tRNA nucleotidyltransferase (CCA-adding enzyme)